MTAAEPKRPDLVTITDVARHAGVAVSTVSYVLSAKRAISTATRERVLASIATLGFQPNAGARALASRRANVIALVLPLRTGMHLPVLMQLMTAVVTGARGHDHDVLVMTADEGPAGLRRVAHSSLVDGVVVMDVELSDPRVPVLRELGRPSVLIGFPADARGLTCVDLDFHGAGARCVEELVALGHRRLALLGAPAVVYTRGTGFAHRTRAGFRAAVATLGVEGMARPCEEDRESVASTLRELFGSHPDTTGLVVHNEAAVEHVMTLLPSMGRRVPDDVSVIAICPDELAARTRPALSSVSIPAEEIGRQAVTLLMAKLAGAPASDATLLTPVLTARASTGPPLSRSGREGSAPTRGS
ncbi:LacI family DNA-binding transcriptional regulator [Asanoa siamensis]|uniref:LacI family transcriptional regulator n=1 Tax=Asanoa siamensis TaxID=926357 RepID=A0ABQ4CP08_9ACTN|nr:LacI family DNA-binding transcriptional regulator [Asanoa siamensis]GIF73025.1 LacI family transcriptional regulator [Asanoa siamensis]